VVWNGDALCLFFSPAVVGVCLFVAEIGHGVSCLRVGGMGRGESVV